MTGYILGEDLSNMTAEEAMEAEKEMPEIWNETQWYATQKFVRSVRENIMRTESSAEQAASGSVDFSLVVRVAERVGEQFGRFQDQECKHLKANLAAMEEGNTGRVRLAEFWKPARDGTWQFQESLTYLKHLGILDESIPGNPRVMIANYVSAQSNCIASTSYYSVCCMDECEGLLAHLEKHIAAPEASAERIASLVAALPSSSVVAPRVLPKHLLERLEEIANGPYGTVQIHGRLFAQWLHHAFPRECPYPHISGTTNPLTPDEWEAATGEDSEFASEEEMESVIANISMSSKNDTGLDALPWSPVEELLIERPVHMRRVSSTIRNVVMCAVMATIMLRLLRTVVGDSDAKGSASLEKVLV